MCDDTNVIDVVIADDSFLVREGTRRLLEDQERVRVLDAVGSVEELLEAVERYRPEVVVTDIRMPPTHRMEGIAAAHEIRRRHPATGVLVLSQYADAHYATELFRDGTAGLGYLLKDRLGQLDELVRALRDVAAGQSAVDSEIVDLLIARRRSHLSSPLERLTPREREVLREMARGRANPGIMDSLSLSESSVEKHIGAIFAKLELEPEAGTHRRVAAVLAFLEAEG